MAYADAKAEGRKAFANANALFAKAATLGTALAKCSLTLEAPKPIGVTSIAAPGKERWLLTKGQVPGDRGSDSSRAAPGNLTLGRAGRL